MAFTSTVSYSGKQTYDYFSPALFDNDFLRRFSVIDGVTTSANIPVVTLSGAITTDACNFTDAGNITIAPRVLTTCAYKLNKEICRSEIEPTFLSDRLRSGSMSPATPDDFAQYLVDEMVKQIGNQMMTEMWGSTGSCNGLFFQFGGTGGTTFQGGVIGVTAAAAGVTAGNVIAELNKVVSAIPDAVLNGAEKPEIYVTPQIALAYKQAQAAVTGGLFMVGDKELNYLGINLVVAPNMPAKRMFATRPSNIFLGTDMLSDMQEIKVIDVSDTLGYAAVRMAARWRFGVQVAIASECVYYA